MTPSPRARRGMTLIEIMVVLAIMAIVVAIGIPSIRAIFDVQQRGAARELALTYKFLAQEAAMRNVTFRIAYHLDEGWYQVEVGDPDTLVFSDPLAREEYEREREKDVKRLSKEEEEAAAEEANRFTGLDLPGFTSKVELPSNTVFAWVYTPQYGEAVTPSEEPPEKPEDAVVVYSYVFASGESEHTLVRLVDADDPEDGFTVEVEPLTGNATVESEVTDIGASMAWLPSEAPTIR
ncbi:MAG: pilus assembly FimT family protein [Myxococcota bacterium]